MVNEIPDSGAGAVLVRPGFLTSDSCGVLITAFLKSAAMPMEGPAHRKPVRIMARRREVDGRFLARVSSPTARTILSSARVGAINAIRHHYGTEGPLDIEFTLVTEMSTGDQHPLHADNERQEVDGRWVPNHTPFRDYVVMIYLNTGGMDFEGGVLRFPIMHRDIVPEAGELVGFTCGREHQHEVTPLIRGYRYSVAMWMTVNPLFAEIWKL